MGSALPPPGRPWPEFTDDHPLRVLVSACLLGVPCGVDCTSDGAPFPHIEPDPAAIDHHQTEWYVEHFGPVQP